MNKIASLAVLLVASRAISFSDAAAQSAGAGMNMPANAVLVAQLDSKQVVGGSSSRATGTARHPLLCTHLMKPGRWLHGIFVGKVSRGNQTYWRRNSQTL